MEYLKQIFQSEYLRELIAAELRETPMWTIISPLRSRSHGAEHFRFTVRKVSLAGDEQSDEALVTDLLKTLENHVPCQLSDELLVAVMIGSNNDPARTTFGTTNFEPWLTTQAVELTQHIQEMNRGERRRFRFDVWFNIFVKVYYGDDDDDSCKCYEKWSGITPENKTSRCISYCGVQWR